MSNVIDSIRLSGVTYQIQGEGGTPTVELTQAQYDALVTAGTVSDDTYYIITDAQAGDLTNYYTKTETNTLLGGKADTATTYTKTEVDNAITAATSTKQDTLVSSQNIKTINNESILGSGNIDIQGGGTTYSAGTNIDITNDTISCTLSGGTLINISNNKINCSAPIRRGTGISSIIVSDSTATASGTNSIVVGGDYNTASGQYSYAEGYYTTASTHSSHSEGWFTKANGQHSHSEGNHTVTNKDDSHAEGKYTVTNNVSEHASGQYNASSRASSTFGNSGNTLFSVGNGTTNNARHNAFEIRQNGDIYLTKDGQDVKLQDQLGGGTVDQTIISGSTNAVAGGAVYNKIDEVEQVTAAGLNALNDNFGGLKLVKLSEAEYNALATKGPSTLYVIVD